ncbi:hypothetical protein BCD67_15140 [Oscillatoriales cyanobacterium USR001]|nr:hypothetical protein BCD67_15140 [Oscillatoriales cyanobacterium USR001]
MKSDSRINPAVKVWVKGRGSHQGQKKGNQKNFLFAFLSAFPLNVEKDKNCKSKVDRVSGVAIARSLSTLLLSS